jgi:hypothetical protein
MTGLLVGDSLPGSSRRKSGLVIFSFSGVAGCDRNRLKLKDHYMKQIRIRNLLPFLAGLAVAGIVSAALAADTQNGPWTALFNGKNLDGWVQRGGKASYKVEDGVIVGSTVPGTPNSFLCTEQTYGDFVLELDFWVDPKLNSGVQIRSECFDKPRSVEWKGKTIKIPAGRVHGYQVEIDPSTRAWTGGIYDEGRRGWLNDLKDNPTAQKAFKLGEWNHFRVKAMGDSIKTWINGVPAADLKDSMTPKGLIALQVHTNKEAGHEVKWRNIRIQVLEDSGK